MSEPHAAVQPFVSASEAPAELTLRAVVLGSILGIIFAASSVYLALKVGMTVSASIPIAVLSITLFRLFGRATILENNIVQTTGSAGESIAAGIAFTIPALIFMGYEVQSLGVMMVSILGGLIGVLMMIPLREGLIVKEHGKLPYPEGTACAQVLIVGEQGGTNARTVFLGFGIGFAYKLLNAFLHLWKEVPERALRFYKGGSVGAEISPELAGVGYIIGPRIAATMLAGGVLSYLVLMPAIAVFGEGLAEPLFPATKRISEMLADGGSYGSLRSNYILYIGAGAVATGGIISLIRALPTIFHAFRGGLRSLTESRASATRAAAERPRTERDLPMRVVVLGSLGLLVAMLLAPQLGLNTVSALLILLFGFFFTTVSARITGEIGSSSNPISGMTVATLLITCLLFFAVGWTGIEYRAMAISTAALVCVAASNGGTTSQDLKTGYLVGATPRLQQIALLAGVISSSLVIGFTLMLLNKQGSVTVPERWPDYTAQASQLNGKTHEGPDGKLYDVAFNSDPATEAPVGMYLVDKDRHVQFRVDQAIGGTLSEKNVKFTPVTDGALVTTPLDAHRLEQGPDGRPYRVQRVAVEGGRAHKFLVDDAGIQQFEVDTQPLTRFEAPKGQLMALIVNGILTRKLPWGLVLIGVFISIVMELCGVSSLPFAVGVYLPISTSMPIMFGGFVRWLVERRRKSTPEEAESSPGVLASSGFIAGGAICGLVVAIAAGFEWEIHPFSSDSFFAQSDLWAMGWFVALLGALYYIGVKAKGATQA